ncbi:MAG: hypothetical protein Q8K02_02875 [Flavobacterium sp.]|nr:hypothetical protein [Flavobacterium sp.]
MKSNNLYEQLLKLIAPDQITDNFELVEIIEKSHSISFIFVEKDDHIPIDLQGKEVVLDGFVNHLELQTFPLRDKTVYMIVRRRRWKEKGKPEESYTNQYDLHYTGMKTTKEFGDFLKEELGLQPTEYNRIWESLTN